MAFPTGWGRKQKITIDNTKVSGTANLSNFPFLVTLDHLNAEIVDAGTNSALNGGGDLRFSSDAAGVTRLACEVQHFVTNATAGSRKCTVWVKVPTVTYSTDTDIYIWYKKAAETQPAVTDTYGRNAVWSDWDFVTHDCAVNSTGGQAITQNGVGSATTPWLSDTASFTASGSDYCYAAATDVDFTDTQPYTLILWYKATSTADYQRFIHIQNGAENETICMVRHTRNSRVCHYNNNGQGPSNKYNNAANDPTYNAWNQLAVSSPNWTGIPAGTDLIINGVADDLASTASGWTKGSNPDATNGRFTIGARGDPSSYFDGELAEIKFITNTELSDDWLLTEYNNQNAPATFATAGTPTSNGVTMAAASGSFVLTGTAVDLKRGVLLAAESGSFVYTGTTVTLLRDLVIPVSSGAFVYTGTAIALLRALQVAGESGNYSYTGASVDLDRGVVLDAEGGTYSMAGTAIALNHGFDLVADSGTFTYAGTTIALLHGFLLPADTGAYSLTGTQVDLLRAVGLVADAGSYVYTGTSINLKRGLLFATDSGSFLFTGTAVALITGYGLSVDSGSYVMSGTLAALLKASNLVSESGAYVVNGTTAQLLRSLIFISAAGNYTYTGTDVTLTLGVSMSADSGSYTMTGTSVDLLRALVMVGASGAYSVVGAAANFLRSVIINGASGAYSLTGQVINLNYGRTFSANTGSFVLTGTAAGLVADLLLQADSGGYVYTGTDLSLKFDAVLAGETGAFLLTGTDVSFIHARIAYSVFGDEIHFSYRPVFQRVEDRQSVSLVPYRNAATKG